MYVTLVSFDVTAPGQDNKTGRDLCVKVETCVPLHDSGVSTIVTIPHVFWVEINELNVIDFSGTVCRERYFLSCVPYKNLQQVL